MGQSGHDFLDVGNTVSPHVVDADIEKVGTIANLLLSDVDTIFDAALEERFPKGFGPIRVGALANR